MNPKITIGILVVLVIICIAWVYWYYFIPNTNLSLGKPMPPMYTNEYSKYFIYENKNDTTNNQYTTKKNIDVGSLTELMIECDKQDSCRGFYYDDANKVVYYKDQTMVQENPTKLADSPNSYYVYRQQKTGTLPSTNIDVSTTV